MADDPTPDPDVPTPDLLPGPDPEPGPPVLARWSPPVWADTVTADGDDVEAFRTLGSVGASPVDGTPLVVVALAQRDEVISASGAMVVYRGSSEAIVAGIRLTPKETGELARLLLQAQDLLTSAA